MKEKRLVLLAGPGDATNITFHALQSIMPPCGVVIEQPVTRSSFLKKRAQRLGWRTVAGQILFASLLLPKLLRQSEQRRKEIMQSHGLCREPIPQSAITYVPSVNTDDCIEQLRRLQPDFVFLCGTRIVSRRVLERIPAIFLNLHAGITPLYRGVHGAYWALVQRQPHACGVTLHVVDAGIDTGAILSQALIQPNSEDCFATYPLLQLGAGLKLLPDVLKRLGAGERWALPPPSGKSILWSHPTLFQYLHFRKRLGVK